MTQKTFHLSWLVIVCMLVAGATTLAAEDRFSDNGDGTVTDHLLNVMWSKSDNQGDINWHQAEQWVRFTFPLTLENQYDNWRIPTLEELKSLYINDRKYEGYEADCGQWVKITPEIVLSCGWIWSSDTSAIQAFIYNFQRGYHYTDRMVHDRAYRVLPVRDLE